MEFYIGGAKGVFMQACDRGVTWRIVDRDHVEPARSRADAVLGKEVLRGASQEVSFALGDAPGPVRQTFLRAQGVCGPRRRTICTNSPRKEVVSRAA